MTQLAIFAGDKMLPAELTATIDQLDLDAFTPSDLGELIRRAKAGEHDLLFMGWAGDNGDPDNFAGTLLSCDNIQTGSNAARWCDKSYDALVKKALLVSDPQARAKLYEQAQEIFYQQAPWITLATGKTFYATRSNVSGYTVSMMGSDFSKAKLN